jgi:glucose-1-phosphatase
LTFGAADTHISRRMRNSQIKLAVFDLGNVLFDFDFERAMRYWAKAANVDKRVIARRLAFDENAADYESGMISSQEYFSGLKESLGIPISMEELVEGWNSIFGDVIKPSYDAIVLIKKSCRVVALSNTDQSHDPVWRAKYSKEIKVFEKIYTSWSLRMMKPERRIFEYVLKDQRVKAGAAVFFDDVAENVEAARSVGLQAVHVTSPNTIAEWLESND